MCCRVDVQNTLAYTVPRYKLHSELRSRSRMNLYSKISRFLHAFDSVQVASSKPDVLLALNAPPASLLAQSFLNVATLTSYSLPSRSLAR